MPATILTAALQGIEATEVKVEVDVLRGLPSFTVVGLGDKAIQESRERMTAALSHLDLEPPRRKTVISLAPASLKKSGSHYDLAITLGYLIASKQLSANDSELKNTWYIGELGLDGTIRSTRGVLPMALAATQKNIRSLFVSAENIPEASAVADRMNVYPVSSLPQLIAHLEGKSLIKPLSISSVHHEQNILPEVDFADIKGQEHAKRALLIAASASHNVLLVGPPGTGKTLLARALAGVLPPLNQDESYVVTSLYSVAGILEEGQGLVTRRPFRSPHHGASSVALVGGGTNPRPGEVSLAHTGVLFLDELPEFPRAVLDSLRQPIEDGVITVSRASTTTQFPARSVLVGAMNPCKCGYLGSSRRECSCTPNDVARYQQRVSGPLLDRFDVHLMVNDVSVDELLADEETSLKTQESSSKLRTSKQLAKAALAARSRQLNRQGKTNAELKPREIKKYCEIDQVTTSLLKQAESKFHLSSRGVHRLLKVARTIADLEEEDKISSQHMAEALQYREQLKAALPEFV